MRYRSIVLDPAHLHQAREVLEAEGFEVHTPPPELLEAGVLLTACRKNADGVEGYLLSPEEIRLLAAHRTLAVLDPDHPDPRPRWERATTRAREQAYLEAALARAIGEMQAAGQGSRNITLNRLAFGLAGLERLGLARDKAVAELVAVAVALGLPESEAKSTARRAWAKGAQRPRDLPPSDFGHSGDFGHSPVTKIKLAQEREKRFRSLKGREAVTEIGSLPWRKGDDQ